MENTHNQNHLSVQIGVLRFLCLFAPKESSSHTDTGELARSLAGKDYYPSKAMCWMLYPQFHVTMGVRCGTTER